LAYLILQQLLELRHPGSSSSSSSSGGGGGSSGLPVGFWLEAPCAADVAGGARLEYKRLTRSSSSSSNTVRLDSIATEVAFGDRQVTQLGQLATVACAANMCTSLLLQHMQTEQ
jgi:hypothetical protein